MCVVAIHIACKNFINLTPLNFPLSPSLSLMSCCTVVYKGGIGSTHLEFTWNFSPTYTHSTLQTPHFTSIYYEREREQAEEEEAEEEEHHMDFHQISLSTFSMCVCGGGGLKSEPGAA